VIVKMIVEKQMKCRLTGETEVLGENLSQRHFCPSQNPGRRCGKPATNRLSYGAAFLVKFLSLMKESNYVQRVQHGKTERETGFLRTVPLAATVLILDRGFGGVGRTESSSWWLL
jgi:hypothetical protein